MAVDTKEKILNAAAELFANNGYNGTSIREIANLADVNIAAVNYHFTNKETLFWENFVHSIQHMNGIVKNNVNWKDPPQKVAQDIFDLMCDNWQSLSNTFRMILSSNLPALNKEHREFCKNSFAPPGGEALEASLVKYLTGKGKKITDEQKFWASKCIFTNIAHFSLLIETAFVKEFADKDEISRESIKIMIKTHVDSIIYFLEK